MGNGPKKPEPKSTSLEGMSNEQLLAMLTPIQHDRAEALSGKLKSAAEEITKIAEYLRNRAHGGLSWKGVAADSFVEWTSATASATFQLADYTRLAGDCLAESAQAMATAKSGVDEIAETSASAKTDYANAQRTLNAARHDPGAGKTEVKTATDDMNAAASAREQARIEALMKLRSLGQTYTFTGERVNSAPRPEFPPPAGMNEAWIYESENIQVPGRSSGTGTSSTTGTTGTSSTRQTHDVIGGRTETTSDGSVVHGSDGRTTDTGGTVRPGPTHVTPDAPVDLGIDSTDTLPKPTTTGPTTPAPGGPPPIGKPDGGTPPFVTTGVPPLTVKGGPGPFGPTSPLTGGTGNPRSPLTGGLRTTTPNMPREGISGGRQVPSTTGRPQTGLPRSTVIGNEPAGQGRTGMGRGMGGAHGMGGPMGGAAGQNGISGGRRLAGETGGVVGGRAQRTGAAGGGKPFTAGGSGLVRGNAAKPGEREEQHGERPDYLVEDEETWQQGRRPSAPPVVD
ncbi:hypothetical protein [Streptomyces sp. NPDC002825]|uniref:WXG100 family type VII secretion target n=1 Tax=Streptomyces sp. NPDC002825 TaxID=3154666 RepID=UPI00332A4ADF